MTFFRRHRRRKPNYDNIARLERELALAPADKIYYDPRGFFGPGYYRVTDDRVEFIQPALTFHSRPETITA